MSTSKKRLLTIKEFCGETRISRTTLHRHMKSGLVTCTSLGGAALAQIYFHLK